MDKQRRTYFYLSLIGISIVLFLLIILFVPDMSSTLINTIPEYAPETEISNSNETLIADTLVIDKTNVKSIISAMARPAEYYIETESHLSHSSGSGTYTRKRWTRGTVSKVDVYSSSQTLSMHYIYTDTKVYIWREGSRLYHTAQKGDFSADGEQMMMSYEDIIDARDEDILTAGISSYNASPCIYAELKSPETGYIERFWVSASNGLLLRGETVDSSGSLIYSITAKQIDISPQDESIFTLPDKKQPT